MERDDVIAALLGAAAGASIGEEHQRRRGDESGKPQPIAGRRPKGAADPLKTFVGAGMTLFGIALWIWGGDAASGATCGAVGLVLLGRELRRSGQVEKDRRSRPRKQRVNAADPSRNPKDGPRINAGPDAIVATE